MSNAIKTRLTKKFLVDAYKKKKMSSYQIAEIIPCNKTTVLVWLRKFGIKVRS